MSDTSSISALDSGDNVDLHWYTARERRYPDGETGMNAVIAEYRSEEIGRTVDKWNIREVRGAIDEA